MAKKAPEEVFTPRAAKINERMFVPRPALEEALQDALKSSKYVVIHGESGNGKTWLYKKVFKQNGVEFETMNLADAVSAGSLAAAIEQKLGALGHAEEEKYEEELTTGVRPMNTGVEAKRRTTRKITSKGSFLALVSLLRKRAGKKPAAIIFDNFEHVAHDESILRELAALIISADDDDISEAKVKLFIVGVPGDIRSMVSRVSNAATIANRLIEIPEVARMTTAEANDLMKRGLINELGLKIDGDDADFYNSLCWKTDRIAQHIQEFCLKIAKEAIKNKGLIDDEVRERAEGKWTAETLSADWAVIEHHMNARETKAGRKNQTLYALGLCGKEDFTYGDIEKLVRREFPDGTKGVSLNMSQTLAGFATADNPILRRTPKNDAYRFISPKLRMAIRSGLKKTEDERVEKAR